MRKEILFMVPCRSLRQFLAYFAALRFKGFEV